MSRASEEQRERLQQLGLSTRVIYLLVRASQWPGAKDYVDPDVLQQTSDRELLALRNFGRASLHEIRAAIPDLADSGRAETSQPPGSRLEHELALVRKTLKMHTRILQNIQTMLRERDEL